MAIVLMQQIMPIAILTVEIAVILMQTLTGAKIVFAMKIWIAMVHLIWLEMASAMMKPIMQNAILMEVTVVGPVLIWSNALNVSVLLDPLQIIYVSELLGRTHIFDKLFWNNPNLCRKKSTLTLKEDITSRLKDISVLFSSPSMSHIWSLILFPPKLNKHWP